MKKTVLILTLAASLFSGVQPAAAKVWRVNNIPGVNADFSTIAAAISGAAAGDTLYLEGSHINYGNVTLAKSLVIIGTGYFIASNDSTQANPNASQIGTLTINAGASGSVISGITATGTATGNLVTVNTSNITFMRCYFTHTAPLVSSAYTGTTMYIASGVNDILITQCFLYQGRSYTNASCTSTYSWNVKVLDLGGSNSGIVVTNNILKHASKGTASTCYSFYTVLMAASSSAVFANNVIIGTFVAYNSIVANNIQILGGSNGNYVTSGSYPNITQNNIGHTTQFGTLNGNQSNVSMGTVFTYAPGGEDVDNHYKLRAGSPAIGAGVSGEDCGAFGGPGAYKLSGIPGIPAIFGATIPATGTTSTGINVNIKSKSHK